MPGHWEGDLIMGAGNRSAVITLVERTSRFLILQRVPHDHNADRIAVLPARAMGRLPALPQPVAGLGARAPRWPATPGSAWPPAPPVFFCDPHSPRQRGSNENTNGLLRQYLPKGTDPSVHSQWSAPRFSDTDKEWCSRCVR